MALNNMDLFRRGGIEKYLKRYLAVKPARIEFTRFGDDVGVLGAAALAIKVPESLRTYAEQYRKFLKLSY